ncbi:MAG: alpha/beta fold hydrolase [Acidobacteriota bacterium]|nr:alpha/beta fold hydrolase [Acidobacteriota bacterium]
MLPNVDVVAIKGDKLRFAPDEARAFLARAARVFEANPFKPHRLFQNGHAQTLAAYTWPRGFRFYSERDQERFFSVAPDVKVLAHCRLQANPRDHATLVVWHGIEGSTGSNYMLATAEKGFQAGFNVIRVNIRNCGGTEHLTPTLYHGGLSEDLGAVVKELIEVDRLSNLFLVGFSLGGNLVLKLAGEYADDPPKEILGVCAVSPSVDLTASAELITKRSNWIYQQDFVRRLKKRIRVKSNLYPGLYDVSGLRSVRTLKDFDDRFTASTHGFANADDYYYRSSAIRVSDKIRVPTLIIHGQDDPFIPFTSLRNPSIADNPYILVLAPQQGGHVGFISHRPRDSADSRLQDADRFWAENRVIEFCKLAGWNA